MSPIISTYPNLEVAINQVQQHLKTYGVHLETESWQGVKQPRKFFEALNVSFSARIPRGVEQLLLEVKPNYPWAEAQFQERIGGAPLNPGETYKDWPYYKNNPNNDTFRTVEEGKFSHTYMERFWPKELRGGYGIRFPLGDYSTLREILRKEPFTRQAYLPIWFPEDGEASLLGERVPCTLGYHFIRRGTTLNITYYIRSCDFLRHFKDDVYMAARLVHDLLDSLGWKNVDPGTLTMHITSLHIFSPEYKLL